MPAVNRVVLALAVTALASAPACRARPRAAPAPSTLAEGGERAALVARIAALVELAPCLVDGPAGERPVRLVDAELAGDAARASFACANGAAHGKVTFFRVAGTWMVSTKEIVATPPHER